MSYCACAVGGLGVQPAFAVSSANSSMFVFGGNVQSSASNSATAAPWNVQVALHV